MSDDVDRSDPWRCAQPPPSLAMDENLPPVLEKLGPSPFAKTRFPFLGFLATVYDHIATQVRQRAPNSDGDRGCD